MKNIIDFANSTSTPVSNNVISGTRTVAPIDLGDLKAIDWNFRNATTDYLTHSIHPYPAKFIPQIPNALIQELSSVGETVGDIFCGSGTTLVESLMLKRNAIGIDANPLACLITKAKTSRMSDSDEKELRALVNRADTLAQKVALFSPENLFSSQKFTSSAPRPDSEALSFWFEPFIVEELAEILSWCKKLPSSTSRTIALSAFSSIVVSVSRQDSDTRYVRREKKLKPGDGFKRFSRNLLEAVSALVELAKVVEDRFSADVVNANLLDSPKIEKMDLVVCSPPYPNAFSYHLYHMTRLLWLGMDQKKFKQVEIGSHRKYSSRGPKAATVDTFKNEMQIIFSWLRGKLRQGRYACFVIGDSTLQGKRIDNTDLLSEVAQSCGFEEAGRLSRKMQDTKKAFNPVIGKIKEEKILLLLNK